MSYLGISNYISIGMERLRKKIAKSLYGEQFENRLNSSRSNLHLIGSRRRWRPKSSLPEIVDGRYDEETSALYIIVYKLYIYKKHTFYTFIIHFQCYSTRTPRTYMQTSLDFHDIVKRRRLRRPDPRYLFFAASGARFRVNFNRTRGHPILMNRNSVNHLHTCMYIHIYSASTIGTGAFKRERVGVWVGNVCLRVGIQIDYTLRTPVFFFCFGDFPVSLPSPLLNQLECFVHITYNLT